MPQIAGIHHLKFAVAELERSLTFYTAVFDAERLTAFDHRRADGALYAYILRVPELGPLLELRLAPDAAKLQAGFDPLTMQVPERADLELWSAHLDRLGVPHSPVLTAMIGWLLVFEDPDGRRLRLYTLETHPLTTDTSTDAVWLG